MLDITNIVNRRNNVQTFTSPNTWQTWVKPRGAKFVDILCIGGGNGGNGSPYTAASPGAGGTGGPSSPFTKTIFPANLLPDILYIFTGAGGQGGIGQTGVSANNTVTQGGISYVTVTPNTGSVSGILCRSANTNGTAGAITVGTAATFSNMILINLATSFITNVGQAGAAASGNDITPTTIVTGGASGGNRSGVNNTPGGVILTAGPIPGIPKIAVNNVFRNGPPGFIMQKPIFATTGGSGGAGGGGSNQPLTCVGGDAAYGSGGGGAGSMGAGAGDLGANGGKGGNGIVIITTTC